MRVFNKIFLIINNYSYNVSNIENNKVNKKNYYNKNIHTTFYNFII